MTISRVLLVSVLVGSTGCSVAFQNAPPTITTRDQASACSTSRTLPWVDAGFVAGEVIAAGAGFAISQGATDWHNHEDAGNIIAGVALAAAVFQLASGMNGFERAATCKASKLSMTASR